MPDTAAINDSRAGNEAPDAIPRGPLSGLRVLEVSAIGPVPMCATLLADLGAEVIRLDRTEPSGLGLTISPRFDVHGRNRKSLMLDLRQSAGREAALRLVARSDVLLEGFRPGVAERLGLAPAVCLALQPRLVYGRMTGYGQSGPLAQAAGHDLNYIALSGALHAIGTEAQGPVPPLNLVGDYGGGALYLALGVLAALWEAQRSGQGQVVDAAMVDGVASLMGLFHGLDAAGQWQPERQSNLLDGAAPFYATYRCAEGAWVSVAALEPKFFATLLQLLGLPESWRAQQYRQSSWPELRKALSDRFASHPREHWCELLEGSDACFAPVLSMQEAAQHPHARQRGAYVQVDGVTQPAPAPRFSRSVTAEPLPAPQVGAHTTALLYELGYSADQVQALLASGAARQHS